VINNPGLTLGAESCETIQSDLAEWRGAPTRFNDLPRFLSDVLAATEQKLTVPSDLLAAQLDKRTATKVRQRSVLLGIPREPARVNVLRRNLPA